jgi:type II secretory pathway component PulK
MNRKGFSLYTAIMIMVIMASIGVAILSISSTAVEQKTQAFMRAQAELYAETGMEYAVSELLRRGADNASGVWKKPEEINIVADNFNILVKISYADGNDPNRVDANSLYMMIDAIVTGEVEGMPIRFVKRTVQLP